MLGQGLQPEVLKVAIAISAVDNDPNGPEDAPAFAQYWQKERLPFVGLPDPQHTVANLYGQQVKLLKLGRLPALAVVDKKGRVRYQHHGQSMSDIPPNDEILSLLDTLNRE